MSDQQKWALKRTAQGKRILRKAILSYGLPTVAFRKNFLKNHNDCYTVMVPPVDGKIRNQYQSRLCYAFGTDRVLRSKLIGKGVENPPPLNTAFINYHVIRRIARSVLQRAGQANEATPIQLSEIGKVTEGGYPQWAMEVIRDKGFIPEKSMKTTSTGMFSQPYVSQLQTLLTEASVAIGKVDPGDTGARQALVARYERQVDRLLDGAIGTPPKQFGYEGKRYTPRTFAKRVLGLGAEDYDYVVLSNNPTRAWNRRYVDFQYPGFEGREVYNVSYSTLSQAIRTTLKDKGEAVFFTSNVSSANPDVGSNTFHGADVQGILSRRAFSYKTVDANARISRRSRIKAGLQPADHVMAIVGYDDKGTGGRVVKWLVENSYGEHAGDKGKYHMYDDFLRHYVGNVVVPRSALPSQLAKRLDSRPPLNTAQ